MGVQHFLLLELDVLLDLSNFVVGQVFIKFPPQVVVRCACLLHSVLRLGDSLAVILVFEIELPR